MTTTQTNGNRYEQRALDNQPAHAVCVVHRGDEYQYVFRCIECKVRDVRYPCYYLYNSEKYREQLTYRCRTCANKHNWDGVYGPFESQFKEFCKKASHKVELTYEEFLSFTRIKHCTYCYDFINWEPRARRGGHHLDRKDNDKGYSMKNCVVCCAECNRVKSDIYSYEEMREIGKILMKIGKRPHDEPLTERCLQHIGS